MAILRLATIDDAESLAGLAERTFRETFAAENSQTNMNLHCATYYSAEIQRQEILDPNLVTILADEAGDLVAFAQIRLLSLKACVSAERPSELNRLYVSSEWHGRGLAQTVMAEVLAIVKQGGADCIWLGVWEQNPKAIAFYYKYGFKVVGDHVFPVGTDPQRDLVLAVEIKH
ncbi:MAG: ribosomal protein S18 acetylase RimI-like enzyme [Granulosicoccus sp.]|jgi:ribosomal protein S18 acetylase RimI-like enzyme